MYVYIYIYTYIHTYTYTYVLQAGTEPPRRCTCGRAVSNRFSVMYAHVAQNTNMCVYVYIYVYTHTRIHTYIHTYTHTYTHTYLHTYIHTYMHFFCFAERLRRRCVMRKLRNSKTGNRGRLCGTVPDAVIS